MGVTIYLVGMYDSVFEGEKDICHVIPPVSGAEHPCIPGNRKQKVLL